MSVSLSEKRDYLKAQVWDLGEAHAYLHACIMRAASLGEDQACVRLKSALEDVKVVKEQTEKRLKEMR